MVQFRMVTSNTTTTTTKQSDPLGRESEKGVRICESRRETNTVDAHLHGKEWEKKRKKNCFQMLMNHFIHSSLHTTEWTFKHPLTTHTDTHTDTYPYPRATEEKQQIGCLAFCRNVPYLSFLSLLSYTPLLSAR